MAIRPDECGTLSAEESAALAKAEQIIDGQLKRDYKGEPVSMPAQLDTWVGLSRRAAAELRRRYEAAGWKITMKPGDDYGSTIVTFSA